MNGRSMDDEWTKEEKNLLSIRSIGGRGDRCLRSDRNKKARFGFATRCRVEENRNTGFLSGDRRRRRRRKRIGENWRESILGTQAEREREILAIGIPSIDDVDQLAPPIVYSADGATSTPPSNSFLANLIFIPND